MSYSNSEFLVFLHFKGERGYVLPVIYRENLQDAQRNIIHDNSPKIIQIRTSTKWTQI